MDYKNVKTELLSGPYLFYGEEKLLIDNAVEFITKKYVSPGMETFNLTNFEGKDLKADDLIASCETLPILNEKRVIFVKDAGAFSESVSDKIFNDLDRIGDFVILIFIDTNDSVNKTKKFYKYFQKNKRNVNFEKLKGRDIFKFAENYILSKNKKISNSDLSYFISKSSYSSRNVDISLYDLKNEMDKIISLTEGVSITRRVIDDSITQSTDTNIFMFLDYMCERNTEMAFKEFRNLHYLNEPIQKIIVMLTRQIRLLIIYKTLSSAHYREQEIMDEMGVKSYEYKKISRYSGNFKLDFLYNFYKKLLKLDEIIKTSAGSENTLFEMIIVEFTA